MASGPPGDVSPRHTWAGIVGLWTAAIALAVSVCFGAWLTTRPLPGYVAADAGGLTSDLFANRYPANEGFQRELQQLRAKGRLTTENEALIDKSIASVAQELQMPPALLWCLFFQESRLDHLLNIDAPTGATGMGQFLFSSFYEVNFNLDRYTPDNLSMLMHVLGSDPRPIGAFRRDPYQLSSYYYIPTAVAASAAYLNNRYHQLGGALDKRQIRYHRDLLWLYAAMAYNKGGRSVLAFWNAARDEGGWRRVETLAQKPSAFFQAVSDARYFRVALETIWPKPEAAAFSREVKIHLEKIRACSIADTAALHWDENGPLFRTVPERNGI